MAFHVVFAEMVIMTDDAPQSDGLPELDGASNGRVRFLKMATTFQSGLMLLALGLAWLIGVDLQQQFHFSVHIVVWGLGATLPMLALFSLWRRSRRIRAPLASIPLTSSSCHSTGWR